MVKEMVNLNQELHEWEYEIHESGKNVIPAQAGICFQRNVRRFKKRLIKYKEIRVIRSCFLNPEKYSKTLCGPSWFKKENA